VARFIKYLLLALSLCCQHPGSAQRSPTDSLLHLLAKGRPDTALAFRIIKYSIEMKHEITAIDSCRKVHDAVMSSLAVPVDSMKTAQLYSMIGNHYYEFHSNAALSHLCVLKAKNYCTDFNSLLGRKILSAVVMDNKRMGNFPEATKYCLELVRANQQSGSTAGLSIAYRHLSELMHDQGNDRLCLDYALKAYQLAGELPDDYRHTNAYCYTIFGLCRAYASNRQLQKAHEVVKEGIRISQEINDKWAETDAWDAEGQLFVQEQDYKEAIGSFNKAIAAKRSVNDTMPGLVYVYGNLADVFLKKGDTKHAISYALRSTEMAGMLQDNGQILIMADILATAYGKENDFKNAFHYSELYRGMNDSMYSADNISAMEAMRLENEFAQEQEKAKAEQEKERAINEQKGRRQKRIMLIVLAGLGLMVLFAAFIFRSLRITRRQKKIIEEKNAETERQKNIIEAKNEAIIDSITYAKRIQNSFLPTEKYISDQLKRLKDKK
jgi:tetratricopeptide (TPR) repeat protein